MVGRMLTVAASEVQEILNYFGKCPFCGCPSRIRPSVQHVGTGGHNAEHGKR